MVLLIVCVCVLVGAVLQRVTGMGFALVSSPFLILVLGAPDGVVLVNTCLVLSAAFVTMTVWRSIEWPRFVLLVVPAIVAVIPGTWLAMSMDAAALEISVGFALILALILSLVLARGRRRSGRVSGIVGSSLAGAAAGVFTAAAGIGGPALTVYAVSSGWKHEAFMATVQPLFVCIGVSALFHRLVREGDDWTLLTADEWLIVLAMIPAGILLGAWISTYVADDFGRRAVIIIAFAGAVLAIAHGGVAMF